MKIVGFEANKSLRLGVVEGDNVIDLQSVDASMPGDLGEALRKTNGDLATVRRSRQEGAASARISLAGLKFGLRWRVPARSSASA